MTITYVILTITYVNSAFYLYPTGMNKKTSVPYINC